MKKLPVIFTAALVTIALSGCATSYVPPQSYDKKIKQQYDQSYQVAWDAVLDMITAPGYKLDQVSKDSGYVSVAHRLSVDSSEVDCGEFDDGGRVAISENIATAAIAVRLKKLSDNRSEVTVIVTGEQQIRGVDVWAGTYFHRIFRCESTGELERKVLDYVYNYKG